MELRGSVALVTGGGTGIGRAVALALAGAGARGLVLNYSRSEAEAQSAAAEVAALGAQAAALRADVSDDAACRGLVAATVERFGRLDILVNNAGTTRHIPHRDLEALTDDVWGSLLSVNLRGTFSLSRAAAPELRRTRGAIVNVASIAGWRAAGSSIAYGVTKAGILQLTRNLAAALAPEVRVNSVSPGLVATRWFRQVDTGAAEAQEAGVAAATPLGRVATAEDVAQAVLGLLGMDMVTGQDLVVDGGLGLLYGPARPR